MQNEILTCVSWLKHSRFVSRKVMKDLQSAWPEPSRGTALELWGANAMENTALESACTHIVHFHLSTLSHSSAFPRCESSTGTPVVLGQAKLPFCEVRQKCWGQPHTLNMLPLLFPHQKLHRRSIHDLNGIPAPSQSWEQDLDADKYSANA